MSFSATDSHRFVPIWRYFEEISPMNLCEKILIPNSRYTE